MKNPRVLSKEEIDLVRESVLIPFMMSVIEKNNRDVGRQALTLVPFWIAAGEKLLDIMTRRLTLVNKELRQANIKVWEDRHSENGEIVYFKYLCRGYTEEFGMMKETMKSNMREQMTAYMRDVFK